jgi:hypothetical protein
VESAAVGGTRIEGRAGTHAPGLLNIVFRYRW